MKLFKYLRLQVPRSDPFSALITWLLVTFGAVVAAAVLVAYYFVDGHENVCTPTPSISYDSEKCAQASLLFGSQYYTRPVLGLDQDGREVNASLGAIGSFPWIMGGFGDGTPSQSINYAQQSLNYTSATFQCQLFYTYVTLRLESGSSTTQTCWYCGDDLRVTCSLIDSERTQTTLGSLAGFAQMLQNYDNVLAYAMDNAASLYDGGSVLSLTLKNYTAVPGLRSDILGEPFNATSSIMSMGTLSGGLPISPASSNTNIRALATALQSAGNYAQELARNDLNGRPFLVNYACQLCERKRRAIRPLISVLLRDLGAVWMPFWGGLLFLAALIWGPEMVSPPPSPSHPSAQPLMQSTDPKAWQPHSQYAGVGTLSYQQRQPHLYTQQSYNSP